MIGFANAVTGLFQAVATTWRIPNSWKHAIVTVLHKKGPLNDPSNYRPISLACTLCKVFIPPSLHPCAWKPQHAPTRLCPRQVLVMPLESFRNSAWDLRNFREWGGSRPNFFRFSDQLLINPTLASSAKAYRITGQCNSIIRNFITGRTMAVRVGNELSAWEPVSSGVPQGSVLGPLRLLIFLNDMPAITTNTTMLLADDSKLIGNVRSPETIQSVLNCLSHCTDAWQMKFNESKCGVLHIGKDNPKWNHTMCNSPLQVVEKERDLGVVVSWWYPLLGRTYTRNDWKSKSRRGSLGMLYPENQKCPYHFTKHSLDPIWSTQCRCGPQLRDMETRVS